MDHNFGPCCIQVCLLEFTKNTKLGFSKFVFTDITEYMFLREKITICIVIEYSCKALHISMVTSRVLDFSDIIKIENYISIKTLITLILK